MNVVYGNKLWTKVHPIYKTYPYLDKDHECDVLIIGGGIVGAICAWYFAEAGINTVLVDKNIIGYASTSASTSILDYEIDYDLLELQDKIGRSNAVRGYKICEKAIYELENIINKLDNDCGYSPREILYYTLNQRDINSLMQEYELRREEGFSVEFLDREKASQLFSFNIAAGILSKNGGGEIDPYIFAHSLIDESVKKGLRVFENTCVTNIFQQFGGLLCETDKEKNITSKRVVIATGYEAEYLVDDISLLLSRTYTLATKPVTSFSGWYNRCLIFDNQNPYTYLRTTQDNRIIIGGEDITASGFGSCIYKLINDEKLAEKKYLLLENKLHEMFPDIKDIEIEFKFSGLFGETSDGLPYIGEHEKYKNYYFCLCYGSNGILYAISGAKLLRDLYLQRSHEDLDLFRFNR